MKLRDLILPLHHAWAGISQNPIITCMSLEKVAQLDDFRGSPESCAEVRRRIRRMEPLIRRCQANMGDVNSAIELKNQFAEALMFVQLDSRFPTRSIPEEELSTPDFEITFSGSAIFIEMKALNHFAPAQTIRTIMNDALDSQIEIERQLRAGKRVAISHYTVAPYWRPGQPYDPDSTTMVVESLIEKADQNISQAQFACGPTILLLDFCEQLSVHGSPSENLQREFVGPLSGELQSGELWHLAFGEVGMPMKKVLDFDGPSNADTPLGRQGLLRKHPFIAGLVFHGLDYTTGEFYGAAIRRRNNVRTIEFLNTICQSLAIEP